MLRDTHMAPFHFFTWNIDHEQRTMCTCFSRGQAGRRGLLSLQMKHNDRVMRIMKATIFAWASWVANIISTTFLQLLRLSAVRAGKCAIDLSSPTGSFLSSAEKPVNLIVNQSKRYQQQRIYILVMDNKKCITTTHKIHFERFIMRTLEYILCWVLLWT